MGMRIPIPEWMRNVLSADPFMRLCIVAHECSGRVEWHHAFTYGGKRINELWAILPLCKKHHDHLTRHVQTLCRMALRMRIEFFKARDYFSITYPKSDLFS